MGEEHVNAGKANLRPHCETVCIGLANDYRDQCLA